MNKEEIEYSPYCEVCGHCGYIDCCGIRNFIEEHIKGKTNCKNEEYVISDLIWLCENQHELQQQNKQLKDNWNKLKEWTKFERKTAVSMQNGYGTSLCDCMMNKMQELEGKSE